MITFCTQDVSFNLKQKTLLKKWMVSIIEKKKRKAGNISFIFCSDVYLLTINQQYLNHTTYTDIITFDYSKENTKLPIHGDIFISVERVIENAKIFNKTIENEMHRVIIHGILHLIGYTDKTKITKAEMTKQENSCLKTLDILFENK
jgi:rRNA maturation RNase YbeY